MSAHVEELVAQMQSAASPAAAESARWRLEARVTPNQVLQSEAPMVVQLLLLGLANASVDGLAETWELLAQLAAGACGPTAAEAVVVSQLREALSGVLPVAVGRVLDPVAGPNDYLVVDLLDAVVSYDDGSARNVIAQALRTFALRGTRERERVDVILRAM